MKSEMAGTAAGVQSGSRNLGELGSEIHDDIDRWIGKEARDNSLGRRAARKEILFKLYAVVEMARVRGADWHLRALDELEKELERIQ